MKTKSLIYAAIFATLLTSCVSTNYFQVYKTTPSDKFVLKDNLLVFEDDNCKVSYNLWDYGGNIGFKLYNKTDKNIYLNLEESFFVLNGISYNYYRNRVFTNSSSSGTSASSGAIASKSVTGINYLDLIQTNRISATNTVDIMSSSGYSVSFYEEKIVCVPSHTSKIIKEYSINETLFRDCDLFKYPSKNQIKPKTFSKSTSPLVFSNIIAYKVGQSDNIVKFENEFYVNEISNYPESEILETKYDEYCGQKSITTTKYFKNVSPDKFYVKYIKGQLDIWEH